MKDDMQMLDSFLGQVNELDKKNCFHDIVLFYTTNMPSGTGNRYWF
ncbi:MAG: hypothetical protein ACXVJN_04985 [Mucilaginibacter sp.]